jgi:hypothetical protein
VFESSSSSAAPSWVYKRDGRLVPFDSDRICQSLFAATEAQGKPDAFLARELTDGVLHFVVTESEDSIPTTTHIGELVAKVVRELGHPALAQAYAGFADRAESKPARRMPAQTSSVPASAEARHRDALGQAIGAGERAAQLAWHAGRQLLGEFSLAEVFSRDLVAAHRDGLITLTGLDHPLEISACLVGPASSRGEGLIEAIEEARCTAGEWVALDGPEYVLGQYSGVRDTTVTDYLRELTVGLRSTGLRAVVNLNCASPPSWADELAAGPLFAERRPAYELERLGGLADLVRDLLLAGGSCSLVRVDWHLGARDLAPENEGRLLAAARAACEGKEIAFVFDRLKQPVALGPGLNRKQTAVLLVVGLHLPRLLDIMARRFQKEGEGPDLAGHLLEKCASLAHLALSAAAQKRDFLRRHDRGQPGPNRAFLLDRARLVVAPVGLESVSRSLFHSTLCARPEASEFMAQLLSGLSQHLQKEASRSLLDTCLDGSAAFVLERDDDQRDLVQPDAIAGPTTWDAAAPARAQLRVAGTLHAASELGTAAVLLPPSATVTPDQVVDWLRYAWEQTSVVRVRLARDAGRPQQLTLALDS